MQTSFGTGVLVFGPENGCGRLDMNGRATESQMAQRSGAIGAKWRVGFRGRISAKKEELDLASRGNGGSGMQARPFVFRTF
jgi:hypothetical protein